MTDYTDDWMNPQMSYNLLSNHKPEPKPFLIQREKTIICTWMGSGPPRTWALWSSHKTREDRDAELNRLREEHPAWHLRPAHEREIGGYREIEVEDEARDLLLRLARLKRKQPRKPRGAKSSATA